MGAAALVIGGVITVGIWFLIGYGYYWLWNLLSFYGLLGIIVYLIFLCVSIPAFVVLFALSIIPLVVGGEL